MKTNPRHDQVVALVNENGFLTVSDLSRICKVSEMTIRRDLEQLSQKKLIQRTYGGAVSLHDGFQGITESEPATHTQSAEVLLVDQVDVLIATSVNPYYDNLLIDDKKGDSDNCRINRDA
jgi:DeoR/GlpR family transcriptional regulator of sugar metabolism